LALAVVDEIYDQVCWIPIFKAKKLILAGDPMQLPPTVLSNNKRDKKKKDESKPVGVPSKPDQDKITPPKEEESSQSHVTASSQDTDQSGSESTDSEDDQDDTPETKVVSPQQKKSSIALRPPRTLETTLFERLEKMYGPRIKCMLDVQYRYAFPIPSCDELIMYALPQNACSNLRIPLQNAVPIQAEAT
jgi:DNA polymerase alpha-associated DNA helicase A